MQNLNDLLSEQMSKPIAIFEHRDWHEPRVATLWVVEAIPHRPADVTD